MTTNTRVAVIMGSQSDLKTMEAATEMLKEFGVAFEVEIVSAHRTPKKMIEFAEAARGRGIQVIIAGAGGAAHLPGMVAALTSLPVIGVPVAATSLLGIDALLSIAQMPKGVPVATVAIGNSANAGLLAIRILASHPSEKLLQQKLETYRDDQEQKVLSTKI